MCCCGAVARCAVVEQWAGVLLWSSGLVCCCGAVAWCAVVEQWPGVLLMLSNERLVLSSLTVLRLQSS